jgi:D-alanyl-D-alanine carboxypeptidase/D-alanyl-D-alanine-endopeptidase (penicillin-binding protein 4)
MQRRYLLVFFTLGFILVGLGALTGQTPSSSALPPQVQAVLDRPEYKSAHWGLLFVDRETNAVLFEHQADKLFAPASVTKVFSVGAALEELGPDFQFRTKVFRAWPGATENSGPPTLVLQASGDLTLGGRTLPDGSIAFTNTDHTYANGSTKGALTSPDPLAGLNELARQVKAAGVDRVRDVVVDDSLFDVAESSGSGPTHISPILVNDNLIDFTITPTQPGQRATVATRPACSAVVIDAQVTTIAKGLPIRLTLESTGPGFYVVRGEVPAEHQPIVRVHEVDDPASFARSLFVEALDRAGVQVIASPLARHRPAVKAKDLPAGTAAVAELVSPPFKEHAKLILKVSHNLHASTLPMVLAARQNQRTLMAGLRRQGEILRGLGVDTKTISFGGGAGGARADYVTPRATVTLLQALAKRPYAKVFEAALPVLGQDGTLADVVAADSPARGKVRAKTGTLFWNNGLAGGAVLTSKALAGYLTTAKGRELTFAMFVNGTHIPSSEATSREGKILGKICEIVHSLE